MVVRVIADQLAGMPAGGLRRIQLLADVGQNSSSSGAMPIACAMLRYDVVSRLAPTRIEIAAEQRLQIARVAVAEQQLLRLHRTGGINV